MIFKWWLSTFFVNLLELLEGRWISPDLLYGCFLKWGGVPLNHPFWQGFSIISHPFLGSPIYGNHRKFFDDPWKDVVSVAHDHYCCNEANACIFGSKETVGNKSMPTEWFLPAGNSSSNLPAQWIQEVQNSEDWSRSSRGSTELIEKIGIPTIHDKMTRWIMALKWARFESVESHRKNQAPTGPTLDIRLVHLFDFAAS